MKSKRRVENIQPTFHWHHFFYHTGENLYAATVANKHHDFITILLCRFKNLRQRTVGYFAGQIVCHQIERLLARQVVALEQRKN